MARIERADAERGVYEVLFVDYDLRQSDTPRDWIRPLTPVEVLEAMGFGTDVTEEEASQIEELSLEKAVELFLGCASVRDVDVAGKGCTRNALSASYAVTVLQNRADVRRRTALELCRRMFEEEKVLLGDTKYFSDSSSVLLWLNMAHPAVIDAEAAIVVNKREALSFASIEELRERMANEEAEDEQELLPLEGSSSTIQFNPYSSSLDDPPSASESPSKESQSTAGTPPPQAPATSSSVNQSGTSSEVEDPAFWDKMGNVVMTSKG